MIEGVRVIRNSYTIVCPPVRELFYSLKLVDFFPRTCGKTTIQHRFGLDGSSSAVLHVSSLFDFIERSCSFQTSLDFTD